MTTKQTDTVIEVQGLHRNFKSKAALDGVSLSIPRGIVFGLVGENGAGKTTLMKHLLGLYKAQLGQVRIFGMDPVREPVAVLGQIGYLSEERELPDWMRVHELMRYTQAFYADWDPDYAESLRLTFELDPKAKVKTLSRGQRAKVGLLLALAHRPDLLLLDEPSSGLDPVVRRDILGAIIRTVADEGRTVVFSSHLLGEVERVADRVAMLHSGKVLLDGGLDALKESHQRFTVVYGEPQAQAPGLPGLLSATGEGREWSYVCSVAREIILKEAEALGGHIVDEATPSLEEIFIARAQGTSEGLMEV